MNFVRVAIGLSAALLCLPAAADELTLPEALSAALERNPQVRIAQAREQQSAANRTATRSMWLPHVDVTEAMTQSNNPVFVFASLLEQGRFGAGNFDPRFLNAPSPLRNYRLGLNVRFTLFDQFRRLEATRQASNGIAQSQAACNETTQAIRLDVIAKYFGLLVAEQRRDVAAEAARVADRDAATMRDKFREGLLVESDALAAEVQVASFRQQEIEAAGAVAIARSALNLAIGRDAIADTSVRGPMPDKNFDERPLAALLADAVRKRGEIGAAQLASDNARLQLQITRGALLPRIDTFASWGASGPAFANRNGDRSVGAVATFDIFDGGKLARVAEARSGVEEARAAEAAARSRIELEIITAYERVRSARQRTIVAASAVTQAEAAARIVRDRYEQGLTTITEHLRAQSALANAKFNLLSARYDDLVGSADLARATGELHDAESFQ